MKPPAFLHMQPGAGGHLSSHLIERLQLLGSIFLLIPGLAMHNPAGMRYVLPAMTCPVAGGQSRCEASLCLDWLFSNPGVFCVMRWIEGKKSFRKNMAPRRTTLQAVEIVVL